MRFTFLPTILILTAHGIVAQSDDEFPGKITCYSWIGTPFTNNTQCPGSRICCQTADLCSPNRFCLANDQIVIPTCSSFPWDDCSNICQYDPQTGFLPRAVNCTDGSFCCDNDPTCCAENRGIVLNGLGAIVSTNPGIVSTSSSTATPTSSFEPTTSSQRDTKSTATPTAVADSPQLDSSSSSSLSTGTKVGIAIGAIAALIAVGSLAFIALRYRRRLQTQKEQNQNQYNAPQWSYQDHKVERQEMPGPGFPENKQPLIGNTGRSHPPVQTWHELEQKPTTKSEIHELPN